MYCAEVLVYIEGVVWSGRCDVVTQNARRLFCVLSYSILTQNVAVPSPLWKKACSN